MILNKIYSLKNFSTVQDNRTLFQNGQELISFKAWITAKKLAYESLYREKRAGYIREGSSAAAAEQEAKISPEYRAFKYLESVHSLCDDQIMLIKKFKEDLSSEFRDQ